MYGQRLRELRNEKGLQQKEAALKLGISQNVLSNHERGINQPDIDMLNKYADFYETTIDYIVGAVDNPARNWYDQLPPVLQNFVRKENIEYLKVILDAQIDEIPPESLKKIIKTIKEVKED